ncbi:GNAT family N-acetyltransferase [Novosphingobium sp.]|uniref:GNAT family N-acetyltransferase n=1 Tax=Novosphingobium sp. TaxID=1874826 RepID=UPI002637EDC0|nr:GNAT family N-acetyltransferase [Novosphingobium sp.]
MEASDLASVGPIVDATNMFPSELLPDMAAPYLADPSGPQRWLVHLAGGVMGVAYYQPEPLTDGTWNLLLIAVQPPAHGQGIGTALMRAVETDLASRGGRLLLVETSGKPEFERTRAFYAGLGYQREAVIRDYYAAGDDKVVFAKLIA